MFCIFSKQLLCRIVHMPVAFHSTFCLKRHKETSKIKQKINSLLGAYDACGYIKWLGCYFNSWYSHLIKYIVYEAISRQYPSITFKVSWHLIYHVWQLRWLLIITREWCVVENTHVVKHASCSNDSAATAWFKLQCPTRNIEALKPSLPRAKGPLNGVSCFSVSLVIPPLGLSWHTIRPDRGQQIWLDAISTIPQEPTISSAITFQVYVQHASIRNG